VECQRPLTEGGPLERRIVAPAVAEERVALAQLQLDYLATERTHITVPKVRLLQRIERYAAEAAFGDRERLAGSLVATDHGGDCGGGARLFRHGQAPEPRVDSP